MSLRRKTLVIIGGTLTVLIALLYTASQIILLDSFAQLEIAETQEDVARASSALAAVLANLDATAGDYAHWDDTYAFVQDGDRSYIEVNLVDETFINLELNLAVFINMQGEMVFAKAFDLAAGAEIPVPSDLAAYLQTGSPLLTPADEQTSVTGLVMIDNTPALLAAHPILTSQYEGPSAGTLIFGRLLNEGMMQELAIATHLSLNVIPLAGDALPMDIQQAVSAFSESGQPYIQPADEQTIAGYTVMDDIYEQPSLVVKIEAARGIYQHGLASISYLMWSLVVFGMASGAGTLLLLEKAVLSRLSRLSASIRHMGNTTDLTLRVPVIGHDELASLAEVINWRLEALDETQKELHWLNTELETRVALRTEQLQLSKDRTETILNTTDDAIILIHGDGGIRQANAAFNKLFGYPTDEVVGMRLLSIVDDRNKQFGSALDSVARGRESRRREVVARRKDGTTFNADLMLAPIKGDSREIQGIVCSMRDVTERIQAEERQKAMISGMRAVLYSASELIACPDTDTLFRRAVEMARSNLRLVRCGIFLKEDNDLKGTYGTDRHGNTTDEHTNRFPLDTVTWRERLKLLQSKVPQWISVEEPLLEWNGEEAVNIGRNGYIAITPIPGRDGFAGLMFNDGGLTHAPFDAIQQEVVSVYCSLLGNIYQRKRLEEELQQALAKEKRLNELKARFSTMISHEFRTPLATIQSSTDLVKYYGDKLTEERRDEHLDNIVNEVNRLTTLLDDILTISKAQTVGIEFKPVPLDLEAFCRSVVQQIQQNVAPTHQIAFSSSVSDIEAKVDDKLFRQALTNLLSNAVKYSPVGSTVHFDLTRTNEVARIEVRDEGIGIPEEDLSRLFQVFHRASNVGNISGTGLGLTITKQAVELHGGAVNVESHIGVGTIFTVTLPLL